MISAHISCLDSSSVQVAIVNSDNKYEGKYVLSAEKTEVRSG